MKRLFTTKFFLITIAPVLLLSIPLAADSMLIKKEPYSIDGETRYKSAITIALFPFKGNMDAEREYLKPVIKSLIKDGVMSYKKYRMPDTIIDYERNSFNVPAGEKSRPPEEKNEAGFLAPQFIDERLLEKLNPGSDKNNLIKSNRADIVISGEINQKDDDIAISIDVQNGIYDKIFHFSAKGNIKNINKLNDDILPDIIKSIMIEWASLDITSSPKDAMIYIDGRYFGKSDRYDLIVESGYHEIKLIKDGLRSQSISLLLKKEEARSIEIDLDKKEDAYSNKINISTAPARARIYLDSNFIGYSPVQIENLPAGKYRLRADTEGHVSKFQTLQVDDKKNIEVDIALEEGENRDHYFTRTPVYNYLFKGSLFGCTAGVFSFMYFGMKIEDEKAKVRGFTYENPSNHTAAEDAEYARLKKKTDDKINKYTLYRNISTYSVIGLLLSAGIFYYLDISQYDIDIALYNPNFIFREIPDSQASARSGWQDIGVQISLKF